MANSTVTDALKKIFLALGGDTQKLQDDHNLTDYLDDLGDALVNAVKAELPAVTSTDNGKVLKVTDGAWAKGDINNNLIVTIDNEGKASMNNSEIKAAFEEGKNIYLSVSGYEISDDTLIYSAVIPINDVNQYFVNFIGYVNGRLYDESDMNFLAVIEIRNGDSTSGFVVFPTNS